MVSLLLVSDQYHPKRRAPISNGMSKIGASIKKMKQSLNIITAQTTLYHSTAQFSNLISQVVLINFRVSTLSQLP